jgi:hypothetical protein
MSTKQEDSPQDHPLKEKFQRFGISQAAIRNYLPRFSIHRNVSLSLIPRKYISHAAFDT